MTVRFAAPKVLHTARVMQTEFSMNCRFEFGETLCDVAMPSLVRLPLTLLRIIGMHPCSKAGCEADEECQVDEKGMPQCLCPGPCPPIHRPVCGSDQRTYSSVCELLRESCLQKRNITLLYEGACGN